MRRSLIVVALLLAGAAPAHADVAIDGGVAAPPREIAGRWIDALVARDVAALTALTSTRFWKVGVTSKEWHTWNVGCAKQQHARRAEELAAVVRCMVGVNPKATAGSIYRILHDDGPQFDEISIGELPRELRKHRGRLKKAVTRGARLVRYRVDDRYWKVRTVFVLDPATSHQTVAAVVEWKRHRD